LTEGLLFVGIACYAILMHLFTLVSHN
jgi:hypothetical protein